MHGSAGERFQGLLLRYSQEPDGEARADLERCIWDEYGTERAVLVVDMSGFSALTGRFGIVHYLSMVRRMQLTSEPIILGFGGVILKFEADNAFAMFPDVESAVRAALGLQLAFDAANQLTPDELDIRIACGIDHGAILVIEQRDFFGDAVNRASKLGEDLARPGDILVSADAFARLGCGVEALDLRAEPMVLSASGLPIEAVSLRLPAEAARSPVL